MAKINTLYRAFKDYRKQTEEDKACKRDRKNFAKTNVELDKFTATKFLCNIDEDWIIQIEKGLEFVEKAVAEDRQFIKVNGDVVPIEKAKKVSKDSVEHLAKHANMITHLPKEPGADMVPDSIYMVEKLSDYAVYENRFLYLLLTYLRDFIQLRLEDIQKLRMTYICDFELTKKMDIDAKVIDYVTKYHEVRTNNQYPLNDDISDALLKRIGDAQQIVQSMLETNLMREVAKAPTVRPPIVKTNVLKMNNNFKNALLLYDYIVGYSGKGYSVKEITKDYCPLSSVLADEFAELYQITSFITYEYGNELGEILQTAFEEEEEKRKQEDVNKLLEQIQRLKKRVTETGQSLEEYMLALEKRNNMLENTAHDLLMAQNEIIELNNQIDVLNQDKVYLREQIVQLERQLERKIEEIAELNQKFIDEMTTLKNQTETEKALLREAYENQVACVVHCCEDEKQEIYKLHEIEMKDYSERRDDELRQALDDLKIELEQNFSKIEEEAANERQRLISDFDDKSNKLTLEIENLNAKQAELTTSYTDKVDTLEAQVVKLKEEKKEKVAAFNDLKDKYDLVYAELDSLRVKYNLVGPTDDYTTRERFNQLEDEFIAFAEFFHKQWDLTKKRIRKEIMSVPIPKKNKKKKEDQEQ